MALQLGLADDLKGAEYPDAYHRIERVDLRPGEQCDVTVRAYKSQEWATEHRGGAYALEERTFSANLTELGPMVLDENENGTRPVIAGALNEYFSEDALEAKGATLLGQAYAFVKSNAYFADAKDV